MKERIQKILSARGLASRRTAEDMIRQGRVTCNGLVCQIGDTADPIEDEIKVDGILIPSEQKCVYIMLNKPKGFVTTLSDEKNRKNVAQLVEDCGVRVYPVGRLDMDSEGLLLFTNDGDFANKLMHPKHEINKTYEVVVEGYSDVALNRLQKPMRLDGYLLKTPQVLLMKKDMDAPSRAVLRITIHEGRNRQVRRMCAIAGMKVRKLTRISEGSLALGNLKPGQWRYLTENEVNSLR